MNPLKFAALTVGLFGFAFVSTATAQDSFNPVIDEAEIAERCADPDSQFILCPEPGEVQTEQVVEAERGNRSEEIRMLIVDASATEMLELAQEYFELNLGNVPEENRAWIWIARAYGILGEHALAVEWIDNVLFQPERGESGNINLWRDRVDHAYTLYLTDPYTYRVPPCEMMRAFRGMLEQAREGDPTIPLTEEIAAVRIQYNQACLTRSITSDDVQNSGFFLESDRNAAIRILNLEKARRETVLTSDIVAE